MRRCDWEYSWLILNLSPFLSLIFLVSVIKLLSLVYLSRSVSGLFVFEWIIGSRKFVHNRRIFSCRLLFKMILQSLLDISNFSRNDKFRLKPLLIILLLKLMTDRVIRSINGVLKLSIKRRRTETRWVHLILNCSDRLRPVALMLSMSLIEWLLNRGLLLILSRR